MAPDDIQDLLSPLRKTALDYRPRKQIDNNDREALNRAGRLLVESPGVATRLLLLAVEAEAHEHLTHDRSDREGSHE